MKKFLIFLFYNLIVCTALPQYVVKTIVPEGALTTGTAFQVQYIVQQTPTFQDLKVPDFGPDFKVISGPRIYHGMTLNDRSRTPIQNFTYTLIPLRVGQLTIKGATAVFKEGALTSASMPVVVLPPLQRQTSTADYPVFSSESLAGNISDYLFVKTVVDKNSVYVGQPVVATFLLYSRLESSSEVVKNPGLYGFSVVDLPSSNEHQQGVEFYNGHLYNTHVIRKSQLYPQEAGKLVVDEMLLENKVAYTDSITAEPKTLTVTVSSEKKEITVKKLPVPEAPNFSGAVGSFTVRAYLVHTTISSNKEGTLRLTISGSGNFMEINAPTISWPKGLTGFEPKMTEKLDGDRVPVQGTKTYDFTFTADREGKYQIAPINFTYFDLQLKAYKTIRTDSLQLTVTQAAAKPVLPTIILPHEEGTINWWLISAVALSIILIAVLAWLYSRRKKTTAPKPVIIQEATPDFIAQIKNIKSADAREMYQPLLHYLLSAIRFYEHLPATATKEQIAAVLSKKEDLSIVQSMQLIVQESEAILYSEAIPSTPFAALQQQAIEVIIKLKA